LAVAHERLVVESIRQRQEVRVATKTTDDMLAEIRRHIDELEARAESGEPRTRARLLGRFDTLREEEASAWEAVREKAEAVDEQFRQLEIDIAIADSRLASELADDATSFAEAVEAELHGWDAAIERLQTRAATKAHNAREQAEAEIAALRRARNRAAERLTALPASSDDAWKEQRNRVTEALDDLERKIREAAVKFNSRRET
jgi:predicted  nucleic acid-binding Zn-ribbon protein